jgi:hypothetical protein
VGLWHDSDRNVTFSTFARSGFRRAADERALAQQMYFKCHTFI